MLHLIIISNLVPKEAKELSFEDFMTARKLVIEPV
jgi:hypothetical protein